MNNVLRGSEDESRSIFSPSPYPAFQGQACRSEPSAETSCKRGLGLEAHDLLVEKLFELLAGDIVLIQIELEEFRVEWWSNRFILRVML